MSSGFLLQIHCHSISVSEHLPQLRVVGAAGAPPASHTGNYNTVLRWGGGRGLGEASQKAPLADWWSWEASQSG